MGLASTAMQGRLLWRRRRLGSVAWRRQSGAVLAALAAQAGTLAGDGGARDETLLASRRACAPWPLTHSMSPPTRVRRDELPGHAPPRIIHDGPAYVPLPPKRWTEKLVRLASRAQNGRAERVERALIRPGVSAG